MQIPLANHSNKYFDDVKASAQRLINMYVEQADSMAGFDLTSYDPKKPNIPFYLRPTPGLVPFTGCGSGPVQEILDMETYLIVVSGKQVFSVLQDGSVTNLGHITGNGAVIGAAGQGFGVIVCDPLAFVVNQTSLQQVTDPDFPGARSVTYQDGYWIFEKSSEDGGFFISGLLSPLVYDALDIATAEGAPDPLRRVISDHRDLWLIGSKSIEVWNDTGNADFPFERIGQAYIERGTIARLSVAKVDNSVFWLGDDKIVYRADGYTPARISMHGMEKQIEKYSKVSDAEGVPYTQDGHAFYALSFPSANVTWVYDCATTAWHERRSGVSEYAMWRVSKAVRNWDKVIVGDRLSGALFYLEPLAATENGNEIVRDVYCPNIRLPDHVQGTQTWLELEMHVGMGLESGQGVDPQVMLSWSNDGGETFGGERWRSAGKVGNYKKRVRWERLGEFRNRCLHFRMSDPVLWALYLLDAGFDQAQT